MKKYKFLVLAFLAVGIISCNSDDDADGGGDTSGDLIGTWIAESIDLTNTISVTTDGITVETLQEGVGTHIDATLTFSEDPDEFTSEGSFDLELTTTILGVSETETIEDVEFLDDGTWTRSGDNLTLMNDDDTQGNATIEVLTDTELRLRIEQEVTEESDERTTTFNTVIVVVFSR